MADLAPLIPCRDCDLTRQMPDDYRVFNPRCLWCGARYFAELQFWPAVTVTAGLETRSETKEERRAWQGRVLDAWEANGHSREKLRELALSGVRPLAPVEERRKR